MGGTQDGNLVRAFGYQLVRDGVEKFGIDCERVTDGVVDEAWSMVPH